MTAYEARLQLVHDCPYSRLTQKYPEATVAMWCDLNSHVFEISAPEPEMVQQVEEDLSRMGHRQSVLRDNGVVRMLAKDCDCQPGAATMMEEEGVWNQEPVIYQGGWEHYRIITHDQANIARFVQRLGRSGGKVELLSLRPFRLHGVAQDTLLTSSSVLAGLTDKQVRVLLEACLQGYFEEPSKVDLDTLAKRNGLSRSTYGEHLRKAQAKLMANLSPTIKLAAETICERRGGAGKAAEVEAWP